MTSEPSQYVGFHMLVVAPLGHGREFEQRLRSGGRRASQRNQCETPGVLEERRIGEGRFVVKKWCSTCHNIADAIPACASKEASRPNCDADCRFHRATDFGGHRWRRRSSSKDHGGNRVGCSCGRGHGQSLVAVQVESRLFVVFSFLGVPTACAHIDSRRIFLWNTGGSSSKKKTIEDCGK